jgi:hypothetical protein
MGLRSMPVISADGYCSAEKITNVSSSWLCKVTFIEPARANVVTGLETTNRILQPKVRCLCQYRELSEDWSEEGQDATGRLEKGETSDAEDLG